MQALQLPSPLGFSGESSLTESQSKSSPSRQSTTRACAMCAKAKAKCMPHPEIEGICLR